MPLNNPVRLSAVMISAAVVFVGFRAEAQMSPIRHVPSAQDAAAADASAASASATTATPAAPQPEATGNTMATTSAPAVTPVSGTSTPAHAVFLRAGPNTAAPVIGTLQPGMQLRVLASANYGWMQVASPVGTGWTYGSYLAQ